MRTDKKASSGSPRKSHAEARRRGETKKSFRAPEQNASQRAQRTPRTPRNAAELHLCVLCVLCGSPILLGVLSHRWPPMHTDKLVRVCVNLCSSVAGSLFFLLLCPA